MEELLKVSPSMRFLLYELINSPFRSDKEFFNVNGNIVTHLLNIYEDELLRILYDEELKGISFRSKKIEHELKMAYWDFFGENDPNKMPKTVEEILADMRSYETSEVFSWLIFFDDIDVPFYVKLGVLIRKAWEMGQIEPKKEEVILGEEGGDGKKKVNYSVITKHLLKKFAPISFKRMIYVFDGKKYVENNGILESEGKKILEEAGITEEKRIKYILDEVIYRVYIDTNLHVSEFPFNKFKAKLIPVKNGVLWRESVHHLLPHSPLFAYTYSLNVSYNPEAKAEKVNHFIKSLVAEKDVPILYEIPALAIMQDPWVQKAYMLVGSGSNGKSTYLSLVETLLGKENVSNVSLQDLASDKFAAAELVGKLANIYADIPNRALKDPGMFKVLTGGDKISTQKKFKDRFSFINTALLIFSANETPEVTEQTHAFWRRWIVVNFPNKFKENKDFLKELLTEEELSGFFNEVLKALLYIETEGRITKTDTVDAEKEKWMRRSNSIYAFVTDLCIHDPNSVITKDELYRKYLEFCEAEGLSPKSKIEFGRDLPRFARYAVSENRRIQGRMTRVWIGIRVKENEENGELQEISGFWGICSYCGESGLLKFKDGEGHYLCEKCAEEGDRVKRSMKTANHNRPRED